MQHIKGSGYGKRKVYEQNWDIKHLNRETQGRKNDSIETKRWKKKFIVRSKIKEERNGKRIGEVTSSSNNTNETCYVGDRLIPYLC